MYFSSIKFFPVWLALGTTLTTSQLHASDLPSFSSNSCTSSKVIPIVEAFSHDDHDRYYRPSRVIDNNLLIILVGPQKELADPLFLT